MCVLAKEIFFLFFPPDQIKEKVEYENKKKVLCRVRGKICARGD